MSARETNSQAILEVLVAAVRSMRPELTGPISGEEHIAAELGLDSIDRVELLLALEEAFGMEDEVDPRIFMTPPTLSGLVEQICVSQVASR
ncbi:acyl carrier protein [Nonomuraea angiospora]|uniref:acyl carrier protein n=1 Tax=Nonomuraea angiospora TaxID=46172 RepID=UPI0029A12474|nr:phosphopantetheine-binding protein [Nonomuraea angiospora]MDX3109239.1 phosphopantetheine-binding protein [Nonomuraea angiospora]